MKAAARSERALPLLVGAAAALFYLGRPSSFYNFDGVACAIAVELGDFRHLAHGNHLAYGVVGWAFHRLLGLLGWGGPAILSLQVLDGLLGAAGVAAFYAWLRERAVPGLTALAASACLTVSYAYWFWSLEAQVYMLGALFLALAAREAFSAKPRPARLGLLHAGAVLGHAGHVMFLPAALYLLSRGPAPRRATARYLAAGAGAVLAAYVLAGVFLIRPHSWHECRVWLLGSAALTADKSFAWHGGLSLSGLGSWLSMCLRIFSDPAEGGTVFSFLLGAVGLGLAGYGARGLSPRARAALLWLGGYALLFVLWEPYTIVYRVSDLLALWFLAALGLRERGRAGAAALAAWALAAGLFNGATAVGPRADAARNEAYQDALWVRNSTPENAWIAVSSAGQVYVPYFGQRRPLLLRYYPDPGSLRARIDALRAAGDPVVLSPEALGTSETGVLFSGFEFREIGRRGGGTFYEVR